jgi:Putative MetA-pathway of phenol degradation
VNPKPKDKVRSLNTDRPTKAPNPYPIDAGHFLMEMDVVNYSINTLTSSNAKQETIYFLNSTLKLGILDWAEIQFSPPTFTLQNSAGIGQSSGLGDYIFRTKLNFLGLHGEPLSLALMPYLKVPNRLSPFSNSMTEGGLTIPGAITLSPLWSMGFMLDWDLKSNTDNNLYHHEAQGSIYAGYKWTDSFSSYLEYYAQKNFQDFTPWVFTLDTGVLYKPTPDIQFDIGINIGLTSSAPALNPFLGFSFRI